MTDTIIMDCIAYDSDADLEVSENNTVTNHDELVDQGKTHREFRALKATEENRELIADHMLVEEDDPAWREEFADMKPGDTYRPDEPSGS